MGKKTKFAISMIDDDIVSWKSSNRIGHFHKDVPINFTRLFIIRYIISSVNYLAICRRNNFYSIGIKILVCASICFYQFIMRTKAENVISIMLTPFFFVWLVKIMTTANDEFAFNRK